MILLYRKRRKKKRHNVVEEIYLCGKIKHFQSGNISNHNSKNLNTISPAIYQTPGLEES